MSSVGCWPVVPLADAFWFQEGPGVRNWQFTTGGIKLLNVANIEKGGTLNLTKTDRHLDEAEVKKKYSHFLVDAGDLVIASSGISFDEDGLLRTRGAFVEGSDLPLCLNTSTIRFKAIDDKSDLRFLRHWLDGKEFRSQITRLVTGTAQQNFGPSHLKATKITLPPFGEQRRIAAILDQAEALRAKRRAALARVDSLPGAIFLNLFGDPSSNPKGLKVEPLGAHLRFVTSGGRGWAKFYASTGARFVRSLDVQMNYVGDIDKAYVDPPDNAEARRTRVQNGDVLLTITGSRIGRVAPVPEELEGAYISQHVAILRIDPRTLDPRFLSFFLSLATGGQRQITKAQYGQTKPGLNFEQIRRFQIPVPPIQNQREFVHRIEAVDKLKSTQFSSLHEIDGLFAALQQRAFRGEL